MIFIPFVSFDLSIVAWNVKGRGEREGGWMMTCWETNFSGSYKIFYRGGCCKLFSHWKFKKILNFVLFWQTLEKLTRKTFLKKKLTNSRRRRRQKWKGVKGRQVFSLSPMTKEKEKKNWFQWSRLTRNKYSG